MPKNTKCRRISGLPRKFGFAPTDNVDEEALRLTFDEFETIRLLDAEGMTQEQCAAKMGVARTTVTAMYDNARKKIAKVLVEGRSLIISGGNVSFDISKGESINNKRKKGDNEMRVALSEAGIKLYGGVSGNADEAVKALIEERLDYNPDVKCDHHGEGHNCSDHHDEDHHCGGHCAH